MGTYLRSAMWLVVLAIPLFFIPRTTYAQVHVLTTVPPQGGSNADFLPNDIFPPAATAATLNKGGDANVNLSNGTPNVEIPLLHAKSRFLDIPVSLNYASNGIKLNEVSGIVGIGWSLSCGGVVNRTVLGLPDDSRAPQQPNNFTVTNVNTQDQPTLDYLFNQYDRESDVFDFSVPGYISGKFILGNDGTPISLEDNNYKISIISQNLHNGIQIINEKGIQFKFTVCDTSTYDKTGNFCNSNHKGRVKKFGNSWYLTSIIKPGQDTVTFEYAPTAYTYYTDLSETESIVVASSTWNCSDGSSGTSCPKYTSTYENCVTTQTVYGQTLIGIKFATGQIDFDFPDGGRKDLYGAPILSGVYLSDKSGNSIRRVTLDHTYFIAAKNDPYLRNNGIDADTSLLYRLVLSDVNVGTGSAQYQYQFSYLSGNLLPARLSGAQDYYGYYNGVKNTYMLTSIASQYPDYYTTYQGPARFGDRSTNTKTMQYGLLNKVIYPTGGYDTLVYDFNKRRDTLIIKDPKTYSGGIVGSGDAAHGNITVNEQDGLVTLGQDQTVSLNFKVSNLGTQPNSAVRQKGEIKIIPQDGQDTVSYYLSLIPANSQTPRSVFMKAGTYMISLTAEGSIIATTLDFQYIPVAVSKPVETPIGGLSVASITSVDPITGSAVKKSYQYIFKENGAYSTFAIQNTPDFQYSLSVPTFESCPGMIANCAAPNYCTSLVHNNSTVRATSMLGNGACYHNSVVESIMGPDSIASATEYRYQYNGVISPAIMNGFIPNTPFGIYSDMLLGDTLVSYYTLDAMKNIITMKKTVHKTYENVLHKIVDNFNVKQMYTVSCQFMPPDPIQFKPYFVETYPVLFQQKKVLSVLETTYDQTGASFISTLVNNTYASSPYTLLKAVNTTSSKGENVETDYSYCWELPPAALSDSVINWNDVSLVSATKYSRAGSLLTIDSINYQISSDNLRAQPSKHISIINGQSPNAETDIVGYDNFGNPLETNKDGEHEAYIWNYGSCLLSAHVINATQQDIAYSSFESDSQGNWNYTGNNVADTTSPTGDNYHALSTATGNITKTGLSSATNYIVSYWSKNGSYSVTGAAAAVQGITVNGWTLYTHSVSGQTSVAVSGNGAIDELRLYPKTAQMTTFTYHPLVGVSSQCDVRNMINRYEYDGLGRLTAMRDYQGNIVKTFSYQYQNQGQTGTN